MNTAELNWSPRQNYQFDCMRMHYNHDIMMFMFWGQHMFHLQLGRGSTASHCSKSEDATPAWSHGKSKENMASSNKPFWIVCISCRVIAHGKLNQSITNRTTKELPHHDRKGALFCNTVQSRAISRANMCKLEDCLAEAWLSRLQ